MASYASTFSPEAMRSCRLQYHSISESGASWSSRQISINAPNASGIQEDIHITRNEGPPLAHTIPISGLTSADITIVHYLQEQGLWHHNVTNLSAREALNHFTLVAKGSRLAHIVRWMKRYGNAPPDAGTRAGTRENSSTGTRGVEKGNAQVNEGYAEGHAAKNKKQGKGNIDPPLRGGQYPPDNPTKRKISQSHGKRTPPNGCCSVRTRRQVSHIHVRQQFSGRWSRHRLRQNRNPLVRRVWLSTPKITDTDSAGSSYSTRSEDRCSASI